MDQDERLKAAVADRYRIESEIGSGGMATVYLAQDIRHDRAVALKVLKPEIAATLGAERFLLEIRVAAKLNHPHILPLHDSGRVAEVPGGQEYLYYSMPVVEGESLRARLNREGQLGMDAIYGLAKGIGAALDYAHNQGVIHRDIKPENILFHHGVPMIADFGIALAVKEAGGERLTETGICVGTPHYMSPEQVSGDRQLDARSDIYALGCVLYEALVGEPPFTGPSAMAVMARQVIDPIRPIETVRPDVPMHFVTAVNRALAKVPADRFDSAGHFSIALDTPEPVPTPVADPSLTVREPPVRSSIAVLPFVNMSADEENEYFSDGMTDELINLLSKLPDLRVTARTSAFAFKGASYDIREIADKLSVDSILEGSVRRSGNQLRVAVQLVDVATGSSTWSARFDRELVDVFAIQDEIAANIANNLSSRFFTSEISAEKRAPANLDAYDAYLKGRFFWAQGSVSALQKSVSSYQQAIELEPSFAAAYAGLALTYTFQTLMMMVPEQPAIARIRETIEKALSLDDSQADAHAAFGYLKMIADWDWAGAETEFKRAIEVSPNSATAYHQYSVLLSNLGFADRAIETSKRAVELDPLYAGSVQTLGYSYMGAGDFEKAVELQLKTLEMESTNFGANIMLPMMYTALGRHEEAIAAGERGIATIGRLPPLVAHLGYAHAKAGRREEALRLLHELRERSESEYVSTFLPAYIHLGLGNTEETLDWLERAVEERSTLLMILPHWFEFDRYRDHPRFKRIYNAIGFDKHAAPRTPAAVVEPTGAGKVVAVLPFANRSADPEDEYFSDGITDDVMSQLSKVGELKVISRTSTTRFRNTELSLREIGEQLNADVILEGTVRKAGSRVRIVAQLIDARDDTHVWNDTYDRMLTDVFEIQSEVAISIAEALEAKLSPKERSEIQKKPTDDLQAYDLYLLGRHHCNKRAADDLRRAITYFEQAIERDAGYADAYAGLAEAYVFAGIGYMPMNSAEAFALAKEMALRAIQLNPDRATAHAMLGFTALTCDGDFATAERSLSHALELDSNYVQTYQWLGWCRTCVGDYAGGSEAWERALELDPLSAVITAESGWPFIYTRLYEIALERFQRSLELDPDLALAHFCVGWALDHLGRYEEAIQALEKGLLLGGAPFWRAFLASAYVKVGRRDRAETILHELCEHAEQQGGAGVAIAVVAEALGHGNLALDYLERAYSSRDDMPLYAVQITEFIPFASLRGHPRFQAIVDGLGLSPHDIEGERKRLLERER